MNYLAENWPTLALGAVAFGAVIANTTKTPKDNAVLALLYKVVNFLALNWTKRSTE